MTHDASRINTNAKKQNSCFYLFLIVSLSTLNEFDVTNQMTLYFGRLTTFSMPNDN